MPQIVINCLLMIGGLGTFLVGMHWLQSASEKLAAGPLKRMFSKTAKNKFVGAGIGCLGTCIIQSSSAMTVMIVGFVNSGVMTLLQATTYIIGANVGTTITAQIVALSNLPISEVVIALTLVGAFMVMMFKKEPFNVIGSFVAGLGLLFLGINVMRGSLDTIFAQNDAISTWLSQITNPFILLLIGVALTALFQSSSAVTSVLIALALAGVVVGGTGNGVFYVILGTNIGSCVTALISSIGSSTNGKRAAVIHLLFNCFGSILFFIILIVWPQFNEMTFRRMFASSPATQIAMFHTFFNVLCALIFLPLSKYLVKLSTLIIRDKKEERKKDTLLDPRLLNSPEIALHQARKYYRMMAEKSINNLNNSIDALIKKDIKAREEILKTEKEVQEISKELVDYLVLINGENITEESAKKISRLHLNLADVVRLSEIANNISGYTSHLVNDNLDFSNNVIPELELMKEEINQAYKINMQLDIKASKDKIKEAEEVENKIDGIRSKMMHDHLERLNEGTCNPALSGIFINLVGNLERAGDHLYFIGQRAR